MMLHWFVYLALGVMGASFSSLWKSVKQLNIFSVTPLLCYFVFSNKK